MSAGTLERGSEMEAVRAALAATCEGCGRLIAVEGPPGIGKSRLLADAAAVARDEGVHVATARGTELERDFAYGIVRQLFEPEVLRASGETRARLLSGAAALAAPVFGLPASDNGFRLPGADPAFASMHGLFWLVSHLAADRPWLIAVDDAHWADAASLRFMAYLLPRLEDVRALVLVATRPDEPGIAVEMLRAIGTAPAVTYLRPSPLSEAGVEAVLRESLAGGVDGRLVAAAHDATGGNPFLVREMARAMSETGTPDLEKLERLRVPGVERSVALRLARTGADGRRVAEAVAVLGERSARSLVAQLAGLDEAAVEAAVAGLVREGVLAEARPLRFTHPLVRAAVADAVGPHRADGLHRAAAHALSAEGAPAEAIALHLLNTEPSGSTQVASVLMEAARDALERGAPDAAARFLERAQAEPAAPEQRSEILYLLGSARAGLSDLAGIDDLAAALDATTGPDDAARIAVELAHLLVIADRQDEIVPILEGLLAAAPDAPHVPRLKAELVLAAGGHVDTRERAVAHLQQEAPRLLAQAEPADTIEDRMLLATLAFGLFTSGFADAAAVVALADRAVGHGDLPQTDSWIALGAGLIAMTGAGRPRHALGWFDRAEEAARTQGSLLLAGMCGCWGSYAALAVGDVAGAEARARLAIEIGGLSRWGRVNCERAFLARALLEHPDPQAAEAVLADRDLWGELPPIIWATFVMETRARVRLAQGRTRDALAEARACGALLDRLDAGGAAVGAWRGVAALAAYHEQDCAEAVRLAEEAVDRAQAFGAPALVGAALRVLGLVRRDVDALREAVRVLGDTDAPLELARAEVDLGAALRRAGQPREAREPLRAGADSAARAGARGLAARAREELIAAGARPRRLALTGAAALTSSERRVAELAATGATNREIAQTLFVTLRTVEMHLSSTYRKLGIGGRSELARALEEQPSVRA